MDKRDLIYKCSTELIATNGYENTTIHMIANSAGISVGTVYNYFSSKEDILDYIFRVEYEKRENILKEISESDIPIEIKIQKIIDFQFSEVENNASVLKTLLQESMTKHFNEIGWIQKSVNLTKSAFANMFMKAKNRGEIRELDENIAASLIYFCGHHIVWINEDSKEDIEKTKKEIFNFIVNAIKK